MIGEIVSFIISAIILAPFFLLLFYVLRFMWSKRPADIPNTPETTFDDDEYIAIPSNATGHVRISNGSNPESWIRFGG